MESTIERWRGSITAYNVRMGEGQAISLEVQHVLWVPPRDSLLSFESYETLIYLLTVPGRENGWYPVSEQCLCFVKAFPMVLHVDGDVCYNAGNLPLMLMNPTLFGTTHYFLSFLSRMERI
jgi:hypothetical protein